jgi:LPXTG-site transpeptidase (sortase) family protein
MKRINLSSVSGRTWLGATLITASVACLAVGLFAVVSALTDDPVKLPSEGSIEEIVNDSADATDRPEFGQGDTQASDGIPWGPGPTRLEINRLGVNAPVVEMGYEADGDPAVPKSAHEVAWYYFTPSPGVNNNAVFTGHVDWQTSDNRPIAGVFYRLRELQIGDLITVALGDGSVLDYRVTGNVATKYDDPNVSKAMEYTSRDVITLITCGGSWVNDASEDNGGNYTHRIIVRAERVTGGEAAALATG